MVLLGYARESCRVGSVHIFFRFPFFQVILMFLSILNQNPEKCITLSLSNIVKNIYDLIFLRITCFTKQIRNYNNTIYSKGFACVML